MFDLTKQEYEELKDKLMLNDELSKILELKILNESNTKIAMILNISERTLSRRLKNLKSKIRKII